MKWPSRYLATYSHTNSVPNSRRCWLRGMPIHRARTTGPLPPLRSLTKSTPSATARTGQQPDALLWPLTGSAMDETAPRTTHSPRWSESRRQNALCVASLTPRVTACWTAHTGHTEIFAMTRKRNKRLWPENFSLNSLHHISLTLSSRYVMLAGAKTPPPLPESG